jgi:hypothetical protein
MGRVICAVGGGGPAALAHRALHLRQTSVGVGVINGLAVLKKLDGLVQSSRLIVEIRLSGNVRHEAGEQSGKASRLQPYAALFQNNVEGMSL